MYFDPRVPGACPLPRDPLNALVAPRPIGWISTCGSNGTINLAPYSYFNVVSNPPPAVMFSSFGRKDSQRNVEETGEFVVNLPSSNLREILNLSSTEFGPEISEPEILGIEMVSSVAVAPPRVKLSPAALECRLIKTIDLGEISDAPNRFTMVIGAVIGIFIDESILTDGIVDMKKSAPLSRLGYMEFGVLGEIFCMERPEVPASSKSE